MKRLLVVSALVAAVIGGMVAGVWYAWQPGSEQMLRQARRSLALGDNAGAEELAVRASRAYRPSPWARLVAAEAAFKEGHVERALEHYQRVPPDAGEATLAGEFGSAEMLCHLGRLHEGEQCLRAILLKNPDHVLSHHRLSYLLNVTGRRWEATPHLLFLVKQNAHELSHLLLLGNSQQLIEDRSLLERSHPSEDDPWPDVARARQHLALNEPMRARQVLTKWHAKFPDEPELQVRWGETLLAFSQKGEFAEWSRGLSQANLAHPEVWVVRGTDALNRKDLTQAAHYFYQAVQRDSEHRIANYRLGQTLAQLGDADRAAPFLQRADLLQQLAIILDDLFNAPQHVGLMQRSAYLTEKLGRYWEARAWAAAALTIDRRQAWAVATLQKLEQRLSEDLPRVDLSQQDIAQVKLDGLSDSRTPSATPATTDLAPGGSSRATGVSFRDDAQAAGLKFQYINGADHAVPGRTIVETTGGGTGVIDFDQDGWPDIYLTQGTPRPIRVPDGQHHDALFRNVRAVQYQDVTHLAHVGDVDYSQGVAVGDYDNDGFEDLYVGNLLNNRLYHNNGDGTFTEVTEPAGIQEDFWTTSCLMADLNGDGHPDLYDVNYVSGKEAETLLCAREGKTRSCSPRAFDAAPDQVWLSDGAGGFKNVSAAAGVLLPNGYGLGIAAADWNGDGRLDLFVANDEVPNYLLLNEATMAGETPRFRDHALLAGLAVDADGLSQACMGVAVADFDGNGLLDLFVTNFYNESNTLYQQLFAGQFSDETRSARLRDPSFSMLGFGAQAIDADLDGLPDLVVTNGHIDDLRNIGQPYKMRPQFFRNVGQGQFTEVTEAGLGRFFAGSYLGRGLARLDWNRDGREDVVISHLDVPVALLTNVTQTDHHFLALRLRGTTCSRDAVGANVTVRSGTATWHSAIIGGDGYHASNQRQLVFGLKNHSRVDALTIQWPDGTQQTFQQPPLDEELLVIQGAARPWSLTGIR